MMPLEGGDHKCVASGAIGRVDLCPVKKKTAHGIFVSSQRSQHERCPALRVVAGRRRVLLWRRYRLIRTSVLPFRGRIKFVLSVRANVCRFNDLLTERLFTLDTV